MAVSRQRILLHGESSDYVYACVVKCATGNCFGTIHVFNLLISMILLKCFLATELIQLFADDCLQYQVIEDFTALQKDLDTFNDCMG